MAQREYDVFVCCHEPSALEFARTVAAGLAKRGFRVFSDAQPGTGVGEDELLALVREVPDFVAIEGANGAAGSPDEARLHVSHALSAERNVVRLSPGAPESLPHLSHRLSSESSLEERRIMRRSRRLFLAAALILVAGFALQEVPRLIERWSQPRLLSPVAPFAVYWAAAGQRMGPSGWLPFPVGNGATVSRGDRLALLFTTSADGHAYVVSRNLGGGVSVLFPTDVVRGASRVKAGEQHAAPVTGEGWLVLDGDTPPETIILVAGYDPLQNLEELIEEPEGISTDSARRALLDQTMAGLLDGRHGDPARQVWNGKLHPIDRDLRLPSIDPRASVLLPGGGRRDVVLAAQPGLVSASVELRLVYR